MDAVGRVILGLLWKEKSEQRESVNRPQVGGGRRDNGNVQDSLEFTLGEMGKNHVIHIPVPKMSVGK